MWFVNSVGRLLEKEGYDSCNYRGCFTMAAAKKKSFLLLKVLNNVDSFQEEQASNLKVLSRNMDADVVLVGRTMRRGKIKDDVVYERFGIPVMSLNSFESVLNNDYPISRTARGGAMIEVDAALLREKRKKSGMSQSELASRAGTTKKNIYEHERENKKAHYEMAKRLEEMLGNVSVPADLKISDSNVSIEPKGVFEVTISSHLRRIGMETEFIQKTPFNIIAREKDVLIFSEAEEDSRRLRNIIDDLTGFSRVASRPVVVVTKDGEELDVPNVRESDLSAFATSKDLKRLL